MNAGFVYDRLPKAYLIGKHGAEFLRAEHVPSQADSWNRGLSAPTTFSMITLPPSCSPSPCVVTRATVSAGPPAGYGTTNLIG